MIRHEKEVWAAELNGERPRINITPAKLRAWATAGLIGWGMFAAVWGFVWAVFHL
jgi:hypothetical protein